MLPLTTLGMTRFPSINRQYTLKPDEFGVMIALDDWLERKRKAHDPKISAAAEKIKQLAHDPSQPVQQYLTNLHALLSAENIHPFEGESLGLVSFHNMMNLSQPDSTITRVQPFLEYAHTIDISRHGVGLLTTENLPNIAHGKKLDYVITGNVINCAEANKPDAILAGASLLKQSGKVIHMLHYGEESDHYWADNITLQKCAGQRHERNIPEGPYNANMWSERATHAMILTQMHEVEFAPGDAQLFVDSLHNGSTIGLPEATIQGARILAQEKLASAGSAHDLPPQ